MKLSGNDVTENILVIVSAFAPTNRIEANHKVPPEAISDFQNKLADRSIWLIKPNFEYLRVFFNAESDVAVSERSGFREQIAKQYQAVIAPYDDFGYVRETPIELVFDSRERFDRVYKGNWFGYDRDNP